jgi:hypothetical protein
MKKILLSCLLSFNASFLFAQFLVENSFFQPTGVSDVGLVAGYSAQAGPYQIWNPDSGILTDIGGVAPGQGVGGQARFSAGGNFISGTSVGSSVPELSRYSLLTGQWTALGSLGFMIDSTLSGGFGISGDGNTVVGLSWADTTGGFAYAHGVAYNASEGIMDLGSLFLGRSTRANAASGDGSVVVGWQDFNGPWKSAVWRKNPAGGYFPNEYILIDTLGNPNDEYNQVGECSAVSADGKWIGGYGDYANLNQPWIWCEDSGVINLGILPNTGNGYVSGMSGDASIVVGWFDGQLWGDAQTPFIWTHAGGIQELNSYITAVLGFSTGSYHVYGASGISSNGLYIAGYGIDTASFNPFAFRVNLGPTGIKNVTSTNPMFVYPNPASQFVSINNTAFAELTITSAEGKVMNKQNITGKFMLDISKYDAGVYLVTLQSAEKIQAQKLVKNN